MTSRASGGPARSPAPERVACVGAVVHDDAGRLLLVRRGRPPHAGRWSVPGGRVEPGEDPVAAVRREVLEETGLDVEVGRLLGVVELPGLVAGPGVPRSVYVVSDYACTVAVSTVDEPQAGDDALDAAWVSGQQLDALDLVPNLVATLGQWAVLPR